MGSTHAQDDQHPPHPSVDPTLLLPAVPRGRRRRRPDGSEGGVTAARAGGARQHGRFDRLEGAFSLALGVPGPGRLPIDEAIALVVADWQRQLREDKVSQVSVEQAERAVGRFAVYAARQGVHTLVDVTTPVCQAYCDARNAFGRRGTHAETAGMPAAVGTRTSRLTMLRAFFSACQLLGLDDRDPTVGVVVPPRETSRSFRPLTDAEYALCQRRSRKNAKETRLPAAVALAGRGATTAELPAIRVRDVHMDAAKVWIHGGGTRTQNRWADLDPWCVETLARRIDDLASTRPADLLRDTALVYTPTGRKIVANARQNAAAVTIGMVLEHAGLDRTPGVRPMSFVERAAVLAWEETGRLEAVAARLGMRSLDKVADMLRHDWRTEFRVAGPSGVPDPTDPPTYAGTSPVRPDRP